MRKIVEQTEKYTLYHHTGMTSFRGCQCYKDCTCHEDFRPVYYDYYTVYKSINKPSTTHHDTLEEARVRVGFINTLENTNNPKWNQKKKG